ncbi:MAG TPA: amidase family protein [Acidimicrobiales bacterium]|nr:amidase family protein [Acidimicrobiales bacterium]
MSNDPSPSTSELAYTGVFQLQAMLAGGELTSVELVGTLLRRIEDIDAPGSTTALRSVLSVSVQAMEEAESSDRRRRSGEGPLGALEGIPVLVKDNVEVAGLSSCAGATSLLGRPPTADAPLVARIRSAGAVVLGTTNLTEWANIRSARSTGGWSAVGGLTGNPWALDRNAGGSSSGSGAAVAAGLAPLAVGTETDGSITCPASLNGVAGIKPSVGTVPTKRVVPISFSQDSPGPLARTAAEAALLLEVLCGRTGVVERLERPITGLRVGVATTWRTGHPATDALFEEAVEVIRRAGAHVVEVSPAVPSAEAEEDELTVLLCELKDELDRYLPTRGSAGPQSLAEVVAHEDAERAVEQPWFGHDLFELALEWGGTDTDRYREARGRNLAWALEGCLEPALEGLDLLVAPTYGPAWKSDLILGGHPAAAAPTTMAPAIAGWPIATVPMGLASGLPVGLGLVGRPGSEADLLALAAAVEQPSRPAWAAPERG